jgi:hypothetical protein
MLPYRFGWIRGSTALSGRWVEETGSDEDADDRRDELLGRMGGG